MRREKINFVTAVTMETVLKTALTKNPFVKKGDEPRRLIEIATTTAYHSEMVEQ